MFQPVCEVCLGMLLEENNTLCANCKHHSHGKMYEEQEVLEDSPLLIDDFYGSSDEFHCHRQVENVEDVKAWRKLLGASLLCLVFLVAEVVGGYLAGSLAVLTDAAHLFSDFVGFLIGLLSIWISKKGPSSTMTFGYHRAEVIGALLSVITIWLLAVVCSGFAATRLYQQNFEIDANTMLIISVFGLTINILMGTVLHGTCHGHSHSECSTDENINVRAASAHILGDILQSIGVLVAAIIIKLYPQAKIADPICTLIFTVFVMVSTAKVGRDSLYFLLERSPIDREQILRQLKALNSVRHVHNLHIWALSPGKNVLSVHLAVDHSCDKNAILEQATSIIRNKIHTINSTIQIEHYNEVIVNSCMQCLVE